MGTRHFKEGKPLLDELCNEIVQMAKGVFVDTRGLSNYFETGEMTSDFYWDDSKTERLGRTTSLSKDLWKEKNPFSVEEIYVMGSQAKKLPDDYDRGKNLDLVVVLNSYDIIDNKDAANNFNGFFFYGLQKKLNKNTGFTGILDNVVNRIGFSLNPSLIEIQDIEPHESFVRIYHRN